MINPEEEQQVEGSIDRLAKECSEEETLRLGMIAVTEPQEQTDETSR